MSSATKQVTVTSSLPIDSMAAKDKPWKPAALV